MGLAESRLPSRDQTVLCFGEDVVPALEKLRLVDRLGEAITHHVVVTILITFVFRRHDFEIL